ncbi:carboxymuconolactone decarboxylase family protein [Halobacillus kuroshimensis]|uniref:Carboxymuconolactone decarboxylase family protein n=1 Tax=Halobacillus kuroshimensis TaxID=302481 RepID=A0ABS3DWJ6_9BACI|nr:MULTISPECIES: carboxymuconolactone decarboxylase family protein [Halobacillus]MBN8235614.1 carboxymuconolactone decarboxylase family protein [Halobacillus kuroshimensis]
MKSRYEQGLEILREYTDEEKGTNHFELMKALEDISPDLGKYIIEFAYGDIYNRDHLDKKGRALTVLSSLVTQGSGSLPQLELHINTALNAGLTEKEIVEAMMQLIPYVGFPSVINALTQARQVFQERDNKQKTYA